MTTDSEQSSSAHDSMKQYQTEQEHSPPSGLQIPAEVTFEQAIALTQTWLDRAMRDGVSAEQTEQAIAQLLATMNGARGFFVAFLTDNRSLDPALLNAVLRALAEAPETVANLLVKNLAMSSAMAIAHRRREDEINAQGSENVRSRTLDLICHLSSPAIQTEIAALKRSLESDEGAYASFLTRWGYDAEQRQAIETACNSLHSHFR